MLSIIKYLNCFKINPVNFVHNKTLFQNLIRFFIVFTGKLIELYQF